MRTVQSKGYSSTKSTRLWICLQSTLSRDSPNSHRSIQMECQYRCKGRTRITNQWTSQLEEQNSRLGLWSTSRSSHARIRLQHSGSASVHSIYSTVPLVPSRSLKAFYDPPMVSPFVHPHSRISFSWDLGTHTYDERWPDSGFPGITVNTPS